MPLFIIIIFTVGFVGWVGWFTLATHVNEGRALKGFLTSLASATVITLICGGAGMLFSRMLFSAYGLM